MGIESMNEDKSLLDEIDESLRIENAERFLLKHGKAVVGVIIAIILFTIGNVAWKHHVITQNQEVTQKLLEAGTLAAAGNYKESSAVLEQATQGKKSVNTLAKFKAAENFIKTGEFERAIALYNEVVEQRAGDVALQDMAAINRVVLATNHNVAVKPEAWQELKKIYEREGVFAIMAGELYAINLSKTGYPKDALAILDAIAKRTDIAKEQAERAGSIASAIREGEKK